MLNSASKHADRLRAALHDDFEDMLIDVDAEVLEKNSRDVRERVSVINSNAEILAKRLSRHPLVDRVYHPSLNTRIAALPAGSTSSFGFGGLLSVVLKNPATTTPVVFDRLEVCKGPNLGTNFTLCCPYTILAHYTELDFVEECGVSRWLLRISIGMEPVEELWQRFERAFSTLLNNQSATGPAPVA